MLPVFQIVEGAKFYKNLRIPAVKKTHMWRTFCVLMAAVIAMGVPLFGLFINLVGSVACTALAFVVPVKIYNLVHEG